jgi:hypothetical protein
VKKYKPLPNAVTIFFISGFDAIALANTVRAEYGSSPGGTMVVLIGAPPYS